MGLYIVGVGGTGAKCVEAFVHLCAAGVVAAKEIYVLFVDPDKSNGSLERADTTLQKYIDCQAFELGQADLFSSKITVAQPVVWSPLSEKGLSLDSLFQYELLKGNHNPAADLMDVLYSPRERTTKLDEGFRGHPSIGAAVMAKTVDLGGSEPWKTFFDRVQQDAKNGRRADVVLFGSIFGGTGAAGVPTIARLIKNASVGERAAPQPAATPQSVQLQLSILGVLMLPYFTFDAVADQELRANALHFMLNSQIALKYYHSQKKLEEFRAVYLAGEMSAAHMQTPALGGKKQKNDPHFLELYGALAAVDSLGLELGTAQQGECRVVARRSEGAVDWSDLPFRPDSKLLLSRLRRLLRFAAAYRYAYYPMLQDIAQKGGAYRAPWYVDQILRFGAAPGADGVQGGLAEQLDKMKWYCESLLQWWANIETSAPPNKPSVNLVDYGVFARRDDSGTGPQVVLKSESQFVPRDFRHLLLPVAGNASEGLDALWASIADATVPGNASGPGRLFSALFEQCGN